MKRIVIAAVLAILVSSIQIFAGNEGIRNNSYNRSFNSLISGLTYGNKGLKISCALTIGDNRFNEATDALSEILKSDEDKDVRIAAIVALYKIRSKDSVSVLKSAAENQKDSSLRELAEVLYTDIMRDRNALEILSK